MRKNAAIIALTGAGISKSCGIPTFQETPGLSDKLSVNFRASHPKEFRAAMDLLTRNCSGKNPTAAHRALAQYQIPIITMNIDGLHQAAGAELVLELHGSVAKNNVVLYGQQVLHVDDAINLISALGNYARRNALDGYFLIIGTSMQTQFANYLHRIAVQVGLSAKYINEDADALVPKFLGSLDLSKQTAFNATVVSHAEYGRQD